MQKEQLTFWGPFLNLYSREDRSVSEYNSAFALKWPLLALNVDLLCLCCTLAQEYTVINFLRSSFSSSSFAKTTVVKENILCIGDTICTATGMILKCMSQTDKKNSSQSYRQNVPVILIDKAVEQNKGRPESHLEPFTKLHMTTIDRIQMKIGKSNKG